MFAWPEYGCRWLDPARRGPLSTASSRLLAVLVVVVMVIRFGCRVKIFRDLISLSSATWRGIVIEGAFDKLDYFY